jgi:hypothetical protein
MTWFATPIHALSMKVADAVVLIVDLRDGRCVELNRTAGRVWQGLESGLSATEIARDLAKEFGIEEARAAADVHALMSDLRAQGFLA